MRSILVLGLVLLAGCGRKDNGPLLATSSGPSQPEPAGQVNAPEDGKARQAYVGVNEWSQVGVVRIRILKVFVGKPQVVGSDGETSELKEAYLQATFSVENLSKTKKLEYHTPSAHSGFSVADVVLVDEHGNDYRYREFNTALWLKNSPQFGSTTIYPDSKPITDTVCFQIPVSAANVLTLTIKSPIPGEKGLHGFKIPSSEWKVQK